MLNKKSHPCFQYANEIRDICQPLSRINISYFGHAYIDNAGRFSALTNHARFLEHYLHHHYYNADIHLATSEYLGRYIVLDAIELDKQSKKINQDASEFGLKHFFTIIDKDKEGGTHYYHFANNSDSNAINQFYINNIDLLSRFIRYFNDSISASNEMSQAYNVKFTISKKAAFSLKNELTMLEKTGDRANFLKMIETSHHTAAFKLTPQQAKCVNLLTKGYSAKQIAGDLSISQRTVENYLANIRNKMGFRNSREIISHYHSINQSE